MIYTVTNTLYRGVEMKNKKFSIISLAICLCLVVTAIFAFSMTAGATCTEHTDSGNGICRDCSARVDGVSAVAGYTMNLADDITVNIHFSIADVVKTNSKASVLTTVNGRSKSILLSEADLVDGAYVIPVELAAKELGSTITAKLVYGTTETTEYTYSAKEYCKAILDNPTIPTYAPYVELVKALLNYGGYAQEYFGFNTSALVNSGLYTAESDPVANKTITAKDIVRNGNLPDGIVHSQVTLILDGTITIRHYFKVSEGYDIANYTFTANGKSATPVKNGEYYCIDIAGVTPRQIDREFSVSVSAGEKTYNASYSALTYASRMSSSSNTALVKLLRAMAIYNEEADKLPSVIYFEVSGNNVTRVSGLADTKPSGEALTLPMMAERANYEFDGWYTDTTFTKRVTEIGADDDGSYALYGRYRIVFFNFDGTSSPAFNAKSQGRDDCVAGALDIVDDKNGDKYYRWKTAYIPNEGDDSTILSAKKTTFTPNHPAISEITSNDLSLTVSIDLALDEEYAITSSSLRILDEDNNANQNRASFFVFKIDASGNVYLGDTSELLFTLTKEFKTLKITVDFKRGLIYGYNEKNEIITYTQLTLPSKSSATTTEEWVRLFTNYYINWNCRGADSFTDGTAQNPHLGFRFANFKLIEGKRIDPAAMIDEVFSPTDCGDVYMRLCTSRDFPAVSQFDWSKI